MGDIVMNPMDPRAPERFDIPDNFDDWNRPLAVNLAIEEEIRLSDAHWDVVLFIRHHCQQNGPSGSARQLQKLLSRHFAPMGGKRYLYALFPRGPVAQACKIAGIPLPSHTVDQSFGSVH